jgi:hypothetical protein
VIRPTGAGVRLRRNLLARVFGGFQFQWLLALALLLNLALLVLVADIDGAAKALSALTPAIVWWVLWGIGVSGWAGADDAGVHWRYFVRRSYPWSEIDRIVFGNVRRAVGGGAGTAAILVGVGGHDHPITPALGCSPGLLTEFGNELIGLARAHGVQVDVDPGNHRWRGLRSS